VTHCDKARSCEIGEALNVEPLLRIDKIPAAIVRPRDQNAPGKIGEAGPAGCTEGKADLRPTRHQVTLLHLDHAWTRLGVEPAELSEIAVDREVFRVFQGLLPPRSSGEEKYV